MAFSRRKSSVVRHENDDGFLSDVICFQRRDDATDCSVKLLKHCSIVGLVLDEAHFVCAFIAPYVGSRGFGFAFVFLDEIGASFYRNVRCLEGQESEEWFVAIRLDELHSEVCDVVRSFAIGFLVGGRWDISLRITEWSVVLKPHVETLRVWNKLFFAKMPFAREEIRVSSGAQTFCNGEFLQREMIFKRCWQHLASALATYEIRDSDAGWILAGHDAGARW